MNSGAATVMPRLRRDEWQVPAMNAKFPRRRPELDQIRTLPSNQLMRRVLAASRFQILHKKLRPPPKQHHSRRWIADSVASAGEHRDLRILAGGDQFVSYFQRV